MQTNIVFFSDLIPKKYPDDFSRVRTILENNMIDFRFLKETKDIWCRDYMPVQVSEKDFVQFRYTPSYLEPDEYRMSRSDPREVNSANGINPRYSRINLDGGNVVRLGDKAFVTARVFSENSDHNLTKAEIIEEIGKEIEANIIIVPEHPCDKIDHADGNLRFLTHNRILINELKGEFKYWQRGMNKIQENYGFEFIEVPWFTPRNKKDSLSAIGIYINYLEIGDLVLIPKFEIEGNRDQEAFNLFKRCFPQHHVEQVNINAIAEDGGLLNCISWDIKV